MVNVKKNKIKITALFLLIAVLIPTIFLSSCSKTSKLNGDTESSETTLESESDDITDTQSEQTEETSEKESESETSESTEEESTEEESKEPEFINPLTGLEAEKDLSGNRPVAIMINNIKISCPQEGVSKADIMYECLVEGGYTRLMMVVSDYESLPVVGSVRSSRDYYIDFAQNHDAIYFHAGGSPQAYSEIKKRGIDNIDGVNMYTPDTFYRDNYRMKNMGYEHSLMTTGDGLVSAIKYWKTRTSLKEGYVSPIKFVEYSSENILPEDSGTASHIRIPYSAAQIADFVYDDNSKKYMRYQFNGVEHIDGTTGEQLGFTNLIIMFCPTQSVAGDTSGRIAVTTTGSGDGYYVYGGKYIPIKWSRQTRDTPTVFTNEDGTPLELNRGNTFISVAPTSIVNSVEFNYEW